MESFLLSQTSGSTAGCISWRPALFLLHVRAGLSGSPLLVRLGFEPRRRWGDDPWWSREHQRLVCSVGKVLSAVTTTNCAYYEYQAENVSFFSFSFFYLRQMLNSVSLKYFRNQFPHCRKDWRLSLLYSYQYIYISISRSNKKKTNLTKNIQQFELNFIMWLHESQSTADQFQNCLKHFKQGLKCLNGASGFLNFNPLSPEENRQQSNQRYHWLQNIYNGFWPWDDQRFHTSSSCKS